MKPGTILYNNIHQITNDEQIRKMLVILNDGQHYPFIAVATTSQPSQARGMQFGCQINDRFPNFFLPLHSTYLKEDTWIQLDCFTELNPLELSQCQINREVDKVCEIPKKILEKLLICAISSKDISGYQEKELWKTLVNINTYFQEKN